MCIAGQMPAWRGGKSHQFGVDGRPFSPALLWSYPFALNVGYKVNLQVLALEYLFGTVGRRGFVLRELWLLFPIFFEVNAEVLGGFGLAFWMHNIQMLPTEEASIFLWNERKAVVFAIKFFGFFYFQNHTLELAALSPSVESLNEASLKLPLSDFTLKKVQSLTRQWSQKTATALERCRSEMQTKNHC